MANTTEYGVFNDEGCIDAQLWSKEEADKAFQHWLAEGENPDHLFVAAICPDHEEQPAEWCELCEDTADF